MNGLTDTLYRGRFEFVYEAGIKGFFDHIIGNSESLSDYRTLTLRAPFQWLNRRSQKRSYAWRSFNRLLKRLGVPLPRIQDKAKSKELPTKPEWNPDQIAGVNLFGDHYVACRA